MGIPTKHSERHLYLSFVNYFVLYLGKSTKEALLDSSPNWAKIRKCTDFFGSQCVIEISVSRIIIQQRKTRLHHLTCYDKKRKLLIQNYYGLILQHNLPLGKRVTNETSFFCDYSKNGCFKSQACDRVPTQRKSAFTHVHIKHKHVAYYS